MPWWTQIRGAIAFAELSPLSPPLPPSTQRGAQQLQSALAHIFRVPSLSPPSPPPPPSTQRWAQQRQGHRGHGRHPQLHTGDSPNLAAAVLETRVWLEHTIACGGRGRESRWERSLPKGKKQDGAGHTVAQDWSSKLVSMDRETREHG